MNGTEDYKVLSWGWGRCIVMLAWKPHELEERRDLGSRIWEKTMNTSDTFKLDVLRRCLGGDIWEAVSTQV